MTEQGAHEFLDELGVPRERPCPDCQGGKLLGSEERFFCNTCNTDELRYGIGSIPLTIDERIEKVAERFPRGRYGLTAVESDSRPLFSLSDLQAHARNLARG